VKKSLIICIAVVMLFSLVLASCSNNKETTTPATTTPATSQTATPTSSATTTPTVDQSKYGGTLKVLTGTLVPNLGYPADAVNGGDLMNASACVETLVRATGQGEIIPWLATDWQMSDDKTTLTMHLQPNVKFHDGTDFNAEAVKYNLDLYRDGILTDMDNVSEVEVVDNNTIIFHFSEYHSDFFYLLAWSAGRIVSPTALQTYTKEELYTHPVGTGPFKFVSYQQDVSLVYDRFDDYWQEGKPYLDGVRFDYVADRTVALMAFESGQADINTFLDPRDAERLLSNPDYTVYTLPAVTVGAIEDSANPDSPFSKVEVRKAISYAVPTNQLPALVGFGAQPGVQLFPEGSQGYNPDFEAIPYDPDYARQLLADAGYPDGFDTTIYVYSYIEMDAWVAIQGYLNEVGIRTTINSVTMVAWMGDVFGNGFTGIACQYMMCFPGQSILSDITGSLSLHGTQSPVSKSFVYPDDYTANVDALTLETDPDVAQELIYELGEMAVNEYSMFQPFYVYYMSSVTNNRVHDDKLYQEVMHLWTPEDAWLSD
jgi:peptide/nickel transport system substrate-binding protein